MSPKFHLFVSDINQGNEEARRGEFKIVRIASAKSQSVRSREVSHHPAFMGSCLTLSHIYLPCLPSR